MLSLTEGSEKFVIFSASLDVPSGASGLQSLEFVYVKNNSKCEILQAGDAHLWQIMNMTGLVVCVCRPQIKSVECITCNLSLRESLSVILVEIVDGK